MTAAGMLKVEGVLPKRCKMFDTPGVPHPYQLHARLTADEVTFSPYATHKHTAIDQ